MKGYTVRKAALLLLCLLLAAAVSGCTKENAVKDTVEGNMKTYSQMADGTWTCGDYSYKYRLEISGRMPNAAADSTFVYLSNLGEITFEQAYRAAGVSSDSADYFPPETAVLVELN